MQLFYSTGSPFARKVRIVIREKGLAGRVTETETNAHNDEPDFLAANPIGKVPALRLEDGTGLFESPLLCEYLDTIGEGPALLPPPGAARFRVLRTEALVDGLLQAAVAIVTERYRPAIRQSGHWQARWRRVIDRTLACLAADPLPQAFDLAAVSIACALGYLDFRFPEIEWRQRHPGLADWYQAVRDRPSLVETVPFKR